MTQEALGRIVSLTRTSITNIEKGRQKVLLHTLADIAAALETEPGRLLPRANPEGDKHLEMALKNRSQSEKNWIKNAVTAARKGD